jgi:hypothetical protein
MINFYHHIFRPLVGVQKGQTITIVAEEIISNKEVLLVFCHFDNNVLTKVLKLKLGGLKLDRKDW